jgi:hypothetical protein
MAVNKLARELTSGVWRTKAQPSKRVSDANLYKEHANRVVKNLGRGRKEVKRGI